MASGSMGRELTQEPLPIYCLLVTIDHPESHVDSHTLTHILTIFMAGWVSRGRRRRSPVNGGLGWALTTGLTTTGCNNLFIGVFFCFVFLSFCFFNSFIIKTIHLEHSYNFHTLILIHFWSHSLNCVVCCVPWLWLNKRVHEVSINQQVIR